MADTIRYETPTPDDLEELYRVDARNFGAPTRSGDLKKLAEGLELDRFVVGRDGGAIVAVAGSYRLELTLPGNTPVPMAGTTWVSVNATHRRRGVNRRLMQILAEQAADRGEPLMGLMASEGGIYERFGYGMATRRRSVVIDRRRVEMDPACRPDPGQVTIFDLTADRAAIEAELMARFERFRLVTPGEITRTPFLFRWSMPEPSESRLVGGCLHDDGYALWVIDQDWAEGDPAHHMRLVDLIAVTPRAHRALWYTVLSVDLVGEIRTRSAVPLDDPLPYLLSDPRALKTEALADHTWLAVLDPVTAFGSRSYRTDDSLVVAIGDAGGSSNTPGSGGLGNRSLFGPGDTFRISATDGEVEVTAVTTEPDLVARPSALGPLLLGGISPSALAAGDRLVGSPAALSRADAFFGSDPRPHCTSDF